MSRYKISQTSTVDGFHPNFYQFACSATKSSKKPATAVTCPECRIFMPLFGDGLQQMQPDSQGIYTCPKCKKIWERINGNMIFTHKTFQ